MINEVTHINDRYLSWFIVSIVIYINVSQGDKKKKFLVKQNQTPGTNIR